MSTHTLTLRIITPERTVLEKPVEQLTATAVDGELSVLPDHEPLVTVLAIDVLKFKQSGQQEDFATVMGGILEVKNNEITVLSDAAELGTEIDLARAQLAKDRAEAEKTQKTDKIEIYLTEMAILRALTRLKAVEYAKQRSKHKI